MAKYLPQAVLFGAALLSLANVLAAAIGLGPALQLLLGLSLPGLVTFPLGLLLSGALIWAWIGSGLRSRAGTLLYLLNALLAPFGYLELGLPLAAGFAIALAPLLLYRGLNRLAERS